MGRYRKSVWENIYLSFGISVLFGLACGLASSIIFSAVSFFLFKSMLFDKLFTVLPLGISGYFSGCICGRYRRRRGLIDGAVCGSLIYAVLLAISLFVNEFTDIRKLILLVCVGAVGGVAGVNSSRPERLM